MAKQYSECSDDVRRRIERLRKQYHGHLKGVTLAMLFVFGDEPGAVLEHQGYPAAAVIKLIGTRERAAGMEDALLVVDRYAYEGFTDLQRDALLDHELYHLDPVLDDDGKPKYDSCGRPKFEIRKHDRQFGWFDDIAQRHGEHSIEVIQAHHVIAETKQLYFDFAAEAKEAA